MVLSVLGDDAQVASSQRGPAPPADKVDTHAVAARLRSLLAHGPVADVAAIQLHVSPLALRLSIDDGAPQPTIEVVISAAEAYAVDPTWILTGEINPSTVRKVAEGRAPERRRYAGRG